MPTYVLTAKLPIICSAEVRVVTSDTESPQFESILRFIGLYEVYQLHGNDEHNNEKEASRQSGHC